MAAASAAASPVNTRSSARGTAAASARARAIGLARACVASAAPGSVRCDLSLGRPVAQRTARAL
eukprot:14253126-Alexandrium_andersonii.AAC.1